MPFRKPWTVWRNESAYWIQTADGMKFAFTYYRRPEASIVGTGAEWPTEEEARIITNHILKLSQG